MVWGCKANKKKFSKSPAACLTVRSVTNNTLRNAQNVQKHLAEQWRVNSSLPAAPYKIQE